MNVLESCAELTPLTRDNGSAVTIGVFDGLHRGHQALIENTVIEAMPQQLPTVVITFQEHPLSILAPPYCPKRLIYPDRKREIIHSLGIDYLVEEAFTTEFSKQQPVQFIQNVLVGCCHAKVVVCGYDFSFGQAGAGTVDLLRSEGAKAGFQTVVLEAVSQHDVLIKSTYIRDLLFGGEVEKAELLLGRPYELRGSVVSGHQRGRIIGFPTANLQVATNHVIPGRGVYFCGVSVPGIIDAGVAMVNIGHNPTFGNETLSIEPHILHFSGSLDGKEVHLHFLRRLRDEQKFAGVEELVKQLERDREECYTLMQQAHIRVLLEKLRTGK